MGYELAIKWVRLSTKPASFPMSINQAIRIGHGYDLHRLEPNGGNGPGRPFVLGGVEIEHNRGPIAHSDGDALFHAVTDALLGAINAPDIGQLFPDDDPRHESQDSRVFLEAARDRVRQAGYFISNLDATIICERPKLSPHKDLMRGNLAAGLGVELDQINIKGKTHEGVDAIGRNEAVEVHCVVLVMRPTP
jgi:2-C-methyl-D-erythritol 2,4-cyclodiphosphate synthase